MKELVILSGKGGTGKTSIVGSLAAIAENKVMADCDVDAADLHLILKPQSIEEHDFFSGQVAVLDRSKCKGCALCVNLCRFDAIGDFEVDPIACEGCGLCSHVCPEGAIHMEECKAGNWYISETQFGRLVHARLGIAQENSGKLVALVRQQAKDYARKEDLKLIICDGPPGTGCPVISSLSGASLALIVTEPTLSGMHDMERVIDVCNHFGVPAMVCINKYDLNEENSNAIKKYCDDNDIELAATIPYDTAVTEAMVNGLPVIEYAPGRVADEIKILWERIQNKLGEDE